MKGLVMRRIKGKYDYWLKKCNLEGGTTERNIEDKLTKICKFLWIQNLSKIVLLF